MAIKPVVLNGRRSAATAPNPSLPSAPKGAEGEKDASTASAGAGAASAKKGGFVELEDVRVPLEHSLDDLPGAVVAASGDTFDIDVAVCNIARRNGRVLLALLHVWIGAVHDHIGDSEGGEIYNALKCASDILLHVKYPTKSD